MMKTYLKRAFQLSDSGVKGLAKSIWSFFLYYVSFVPPMICVFLFADRLLNGNTGKPVVYLLFMLAATLVMYLVINYNYKTTYDETYQESANLRIDLAEQLSKLPLSYFSKHNLSDLAQTIMADVASIEHAFANAVANSIGFAIYFLVISVALLIMNWKLGLCVLLPVLTSASVLFLTKKLQVRDVNKHYDKLRDISESFQNAIELNQEIKSYGLKENGVGILMVTHDFATALQLGGNVLVMKEGKIIESGEVQSVFDHTTEPYTRSLIEAYSLSCAFTKGAES